MRSILLILCLLVVVMGNMSAFGEEPQATGTYDANTGDIEFDAILGNLNIEAEENLADFITNLSITYKIPKEKMPPADVYMTAAIANMTDKPVEAVVKEYKANQGKGWGVIAKRLGIKPGSKEFHTLKSGGIAELEKAKGKENKKIRNLDKTRNLGKEKKSSKRSLPKRNKSQRSTSLRMTWLRAGCPP